MRPCALAFALLLTTTTANLAAQEPWVILDSLPSPTGSTQQTACVVADFNVDGLDDFVVASRKPSGRIELWLSGEIWTRHMVEPTA